MKNISSSRMILSFALTLAVLACLSSGCAKVSRNGDLDGMWQVMEVTKAGVEEPLPEGFRCYYNFYLHTCQLSTSDGRVPGMTGNMTVGDDEVAVQFPFVSQGEVDAVWIGRLRYWGLPESGEAVFDILSLDSKALVLGREDVRVSCRKF